LLRQFAHVLAERGYYSRRVLARHLELAFRDAELCVAALEESFSGTRPFEVAMDEYQRTRDAQVKAMYEFTCQLATLEPLPPETQQLFGALPGNREAMDRFARMNAGTISPAEFFAPENVMRLLPPQLQALTI
jgi:2-polyprenyl-6-methoxyphenol hydroxylase-like FAD-dependent oxidoreductase